MSVSALSEFSPSVMPFKSHCSLIELQRSGCFQYSGILTQFVSGINIPCILTLLSQGSFSFPANLGQRGLTICWSNSWEFVTFNCRTLNCWQWFRGAWCSSHWSTGNGCLSLNGVFVSVGQLMQPRTALFGDRVFLAGCGPCCASTASICLIKKCKQLTFSILEIWVVSWEKGH